MNPVRKLFTTPSLLKVFREPSLRNFHLNAAHNRKHHKLTDCAPNTDQKELKSKSSKSKHKQKSLKAEISKCYETKKSPQPDCKQKVEPKKESKKCEKPKQSLECKPKAELKKPDMIKEPPPPSKVPLPTKPPCRPKVDLDKCKEMRKLKCAPKKEPKPGEYQRPKCCEDKIGPKKDS